MQGQRHSIGVFAFMVGCSCTPSAEEQAASDRLMAETHCANATIAYNQADGRIALGQWDQAAAENLDHISPQQELEIRESLGRQMGLAPSQVNGWREIYKARAETAGRQIAEARAEMTRLREERDEACAERDRLRGAAIS